MQFSRRVEIESRASESSNVEGDNGEEINWEALARLPTLKRSQYGFLHGVAGEFKQVEIKKLRFSERRALLNRFVRNVDHNDFFLQKLKSRMNSVGLAQPTIEVRFEKLNTETFAHVGNRAIPTICNYFVNMVEGMLNYLHLLPSQKKRIQILHDLNGIIKPGRMTLLLGPPSSGKTTLLLALSGLLDSELKVSGKVTYNGHEMHEFVPQKCSAYVSQNDIHIGGLTVRETLAFSARCQGVGPTYDTLLELLRKEKEANVKPDPFIDVLMKALVLRGQRENMSTEYVLKILGLEECADTIIGDSMTRGISGGQKKRVTIGEMLVGPAIAFFMDSISVGLDSFTTFQIINAIRQSVHILNKTALISLLQPPPETYDLFDDIILLSEGQIVYQGPRVHVLEFFESMGFKCPERKAVADFLQEVMSRKDQAQFWAREAESYTYVSAKEFGDAFKGSHIGRAIQHELAIPFDKSMSHPAALTRSKFGTDKKELLHACLTRELLLMKRNLLVFLLQLIQLVVLGFITASAFAEDKKHHNTVEDGKVHMGALFCLLTTIVLSGWPALTMTVSKLPVFYKQRNLSFYPSWVYSLPTLIPGVFLSFSEVSLWVVTTYFIIRFEQNIIRFLKHLLILILGGQMSYSLFRCIGAVTRDDIVGNLVANLAVMWLIIFSGFVLSHEVIKKWMIWAYWTSPLMYVQNAIATNEFLGKSWNQAPAGSTETIGVLVLEAKGAFTNPDWFWIGSCALLGFIILFAFLANLALICFKPYGQSHTACLHGEGTSDERANIAGEIDGDRTENNAQEAASVGKHQEDTGMSLPFKPLCITFDNITYSVDMPKERKEIGTPRERLVLLNRVSGAFRPGVLTALMGVTGAGKTTLLDVLAGRKNSGYIEGNISVSGYPKNQQTFARVSGYCEQNDIHSPLVTVYESLVFSASLRLPQNVSSKTRQKFIDEIMELIELTLIRDALIGVPNVNGLSLEQRKRLTIAVELVANPSILFMDEPTSGLDARAAAIIMRVVRNTVDTGRTVVCTIHQPSIHIFESFDELFLLKPGGEELYVGPLGHQSHNLIKYFEAINGVPKIRDGYNPATWVMEVTTRAQEEQLGINFAIIYRNSELYRRNKALIRELSSPTFSSEDLCFSTRYPQSYLTQWKVCLWRQYKAYWRNTAYNGVRFVVNVISALMFGIVFWDIGYKRHKQAEIIASVGSMYVATMFMGAQTSSAIRPVIASEREIFYRERASGLYAALPYAFSQVVIEIPYTLAQVSIFVIIDYFMTGLEWTVPKFSRHFLFMLLSFLYFTYYGMMIISMTPNQEIASILSSLIYSMWNLFAGFAIPRTRLPWWWKWYSWVCPVSWSMYGLVTSNYGDDQSKLETGETVAEFVKNHFGFKQEHSWMVATVLLGFNLLFIVVHIFSTRVFNFQKR